MADPELPKPTKVNARELGLFERRVHDRIGDDTTLLGLGHVAAPNRKRPPVGVGRLELRLRGEESSARDEVDARRSKADELHVVRTLESRDLERWCCSRDKPAAATATLLARAELMCAGRAPRSV